MLKRLLGRRVVAMFAVAGLAFGLVTSWLFVWPSALPAEEIEPADAVLMFAGGTGERLDAVFELMALGVAPTLVLPNGTIPGWGRGNRLCAGEAGVDFEVICPSPDPDNTRGEAQAMVEVATERGWTSLIVVSSEYHLTRASLRLDRCFDGEIQRVNAGPNRSRRAWPSLIVHEWLGLAQAQLLERDC